MRNVLFCSLLLLVAAILLSCQKEPPQEPDYSSPEEPPTGPDTAFYVPWNKPYLLINNLEFQEESISQPGQDSGVTYLSFTGLLDREIQDAVNRMIRNTAERFASFGPAGAEPKPGQGSKYLYWSIIANYNNLLGLRYHGYSPHSDEYHGGGFLIELTGGRVLNLTDLFADKERCLTLISNAIKEEIIRQNFEEEVLYRPFNRIAENQPFALYEGFLEIIFPRGNPYSIGGQETSFYLPFHLFGDEFVILGKYRTDQPIFEKAAFQKHMLPGPVKVKPKIIEEQGPGYAVNVYYIELDNLPNLELQERLNRQFAAEAAAFAEDQAFTRQAVEDYDRNNQAFSHKDRHIYMTANYADILCIVRYDSIYRSWTGKHEYGRQTYLFDTITGQPLALEDLFREGVDYVSVINRHIRDEIAQYEPESRPPLFTITAVTGFYLAGNYFYVYIEGDDAFLAHEFGIPFEAFGENALIFH